MATRENPGLSLAVHTGAVLEEKNDGNHQDEVGADHTGARCTLLNPGHAALGADGKRPDSFSPANDETGLRSMQLVVVLEKVARPRGTSPQIAPGAGRRFLLDLVRLCACRRLWTIAVLLGLFAAGHTQAGGSPETTLVVVNGDSMESRQIANHYLSMRDIPRTNLVWLDQIPE